MAIIIVEEIGMEPIKQASTIRVLIELVSKVAATKLVNCQRSHLYLNQNLGFLVWVCYQP